MQEEEEISIHLLNNFFNSEWPHLHSVYHKNTKKTMIKLLFIPLVTLLWEYKQNSHFDWCTIKDKYDIAFLLSE